MPDHARPVGADDGREKPLVLVIDDLELNVVLLEEKLCAQGFDTIHAFSGPGGLELAERALPDIVLLDVMMPRMDGFEVCRRLKANAVTAEIPVMLLTALSGTEDRMRGREVGADDFVVKPVGDDDLLARIRALIRR